MYVLIIFWLAAPQGNQIGITPISITSIEFSSLANCTAAQNTLMKAEIPGNKFYLCAKK